MCAGSNGVGGPAVEGVADAGQQAGIGREGQGDAFRFNLLCRNFVAADSGSKFPVRSIYTYLWKSK